MAPSHAVSSDVVADTRGLNEHSKTLSKCQMLFFDVVKEWLEKPQKTLVVVSGGPGTGKSYLVKNTFKYIKTTQCRMSYTGRSAAVIGGKTIHSTLKLRPDAVEKLEKELEAEADLFQSIKKSRSIVEEFVYDDQPYVVIVDEVSMINGWLMYWIIRFFMDRTNLPLFFVCMGDPHQLNPIRSSYNLFSLKFSQTKYKFLKIHLTESQRYTPEYEKIVNTLRSFVDKNDETGMLSFICEKYPVVDDIDGPMLMTADKAMAFKNSTVKDYNNYYIKNKIDGPEIKLHDDLVLKKNCMVFVTRNNFNVTNGTPLIFEHYLSDENQVLCKDPNTDKDVRVGINFYLGKFPLDLGFAGTVHKYQGDTIDNAKIILNLDGSRDLNLIYTALSRVRHINQILAIKI